MTISMLLASIVIASLIVLLMYKQHAILIMLLAYLICYPLSKTSGCAAAFAVYVDVSLVNWIIAKMIYCIDMILNIRNSIKGRNLLFSTLHRKIGIFCITIAAELTRISQSKSGRKHIENALDCTAIKRLISQTLLYSKYYIEHNLDKYKLNELSNILSDLLPAKIDEFHVEMPRIPRMEKNKYFTHQIQLWTVVYLKNYSKLTLANQSSNKQCTKHNECLCFKRVIFIMQMLSNYNQSKMNGNKRNRSKLKKKKDDKIITKENILCMIKCGNYSSIQFQNDFYHIISNHLSKNERSWNYAEACLLKEWCTYNKSCFLYKRHKRTSKYDKNKKLRSIIYDQLFKSSDVVIFQLLDTVHHYLMHSKMKSHSFSKSKKISNIIKVKDQTKKPLLTAVTKDTQQVRDSRDTNIDIDETDRRNRFMTNADILNEQLFSFGVRFKHYSYYSRYKMYIDEPKYKNLKEELFNNIWYPVCSFEWYDTLERAITNYYTVTAKQLKADRNGDANFIQRMPADIGITVSHLFVILFYTNYTPPQHKFKQNCFGYNRSLSDEIIKEQHKEIANYYRLLHETILFYGKVPSKNDTFYHGLTKTLYFTEFHCTFNAPISTTKLESAAETFCGDSGNGMLLSLKPDNSVFDYYFDCWCSAHPEEREALFCVSEHLYIADIKLQQCRFTDLKLSEYIIAMTILQHIMNGTYFSYLIPDFKQYECYIIQLFEHYQSQTNYISDYIQKSFEVRYNKYKQQKIINVIPSEFNLLDLNTQSVINKHFNINNMMPEFEWFVDTDQLQQGLKRTDNYVQSVEKFTYSNEENDISFDFHFYLKPNIIGPILYKTSKVSVGIVLCKDCHIKTNSFVKIQWGFKCKEMNYCLPKSVIAFKKYISSDAFKTFSSINLENEKIKQLHFIFYIRYLDHEHDDNVM